MRAITWQFIGSTLALSLYMLAVSPTVSAQTLYGWYDEQGNRHLTSTLPAEAVVRGYDILSRYGGVLKTVAPAKSLEEIKREKDLEALREQQARLVARQKEEDRRLLARFSNVDDLIMVREGTIRAIDVRAEGTRMHIKQQQKWLAGLRTQAAELERAGKPLSTQLNDSIANTQLAINDLYEKLVELEDQKQQTRGRFARDLVRLKQLLRVDEDEMLSQDATLTREIGNLIKCSNGPQCDRLWMMAVEYVEQHATVPIETSTPELILTSVPREKGDISLSLSRVEDKRGGATIFLDLQCPGADVKSNTCATPRSTAILEGFASSLRRQEGADTGGS